MMRLSPWRPRHRTDPEHHLDDATIAALLRGDGIVAVAEASDHAALCGACRHRLEAADPLLVLFDDEPLPALRPARVPLPEPPPIRSPRRWQLWPTILGARGWVLHAGSGRRWQLSAGLGLAAASAAAVFIVAHQPHPGAPQPSPIAQLTAAIRTAAQRHDDAALHRSLAEARTELQYIDSIPGGDPSLRSDLESLRGEVETLPQDAETVAVVQGVDEAIQDQDEVAPPDASPPPTEQPAPSPTEVPTPTEQPTPEPTLAPADQPTATAAPTLDTTVTTTPVAIIPAHRPGAIAS